MNPTDLLTNIITKILGDKAEAAAYAEDPSGYLLAAGLGACDLSEIDMAEVAAEVSNELVLAPEVSEQLVEVSAAGPVGESPAPSSSPSSAPSSSPSSSPSPSRRSSHARSSR